MSKLPGYDSHDTLIINHAQLRAPVDMQAECQQQLLNLEGLSQASGEYLFLRELSVTSSARQLATDIRLKLMEQNDLAIEGDSVDVENAQVIRFTSLGQLLAQLSLHIQMGRNDLWYWQSWQHLFEMPVADALALLWSEYATDLTDMVQVLAQRGELKRFWTSLSKDQAQLILKSVKRAFGLDSKVKQSKIEIASPNNTPGLPINALSPWRVLEGYFVQYDKRLELASLIVLLRWRPDYLLQQNSNQNIKLVSQQLCGNNSEQSHSSLHTLKSTDNNASRNETNNNQNNNDMGVSYSGRKTTESDRNNFTGLNNTEQSEIIKNKLDESEFETKLNSKVQANKQHELTEEYLHNSSVSDRLSTEGHSIILNTGNTVKSEACDDLVENNSSGEGANHLHGSQQTEQILEIEGIESNSQVYTDRGAPFCQQGGVFYLLNFMARKTTQSLLHKYKAYETLKGPWGCLYRLADLLDKNDDAALDQFFIYRMGLDSVEELKQLPPLSHAEQYQQYAEKLYGSLVWNSKLLSIPAQIEYTSSHLDIHYPLHRVDLDVRRVGLDINPGWLSWLGQVVNFHYHAKLTSDVVSH